MAQTRGPINLTDRDREILKDVILSYILSAEPVSSRSVAKKGRLGLSAATIRNAMADLEELGLLAQPHTSAGRVPTRAAYHLFIETMMEARNVSSRERRYIAGTLASTGADAETLMGSASHLLSELSSHVGLVLAPALGDTVLREVDFVPLSGRKVLCVVVSATGFVDNKIVESAEAFSREELIQISNYLRESFAGLTLRQIRDRLVKLMGEERAQLDRMLARTIELAQAGLAVDDEPSVLLDGASGLLAKPELTDVHRVRRMFEAFADKARLVTLLNQCLTGGGVRVLIGDDSALTSELDFSLVATRYGTADQPLGTLGVLGPSRMEYQKIIPLVHYLGEALSRALTEGFDGGPAGTPAPSGTPSGNY